MPVPLTEFSVSRTPERSHSSGSNLVSQTDEGDSQHLARKQANAISYPWDRLVQSFTSHMIDETSVVLDRYDYDLRRNELGVR